jgi:Acetyl xylan esterase (AXE1).
MSVQDLEKYSSSYGFYDLKNQLRDFVYKWSNEAFTAGDAARDAIRSLDELESRRELLRKKFIEAIGGLPSSDTPLNPQITGTIQCDGYRIEKIIFESRPKTFVTANLYVPDGITSPRGAVLFLCGHFEQAKHVDEYQVVCQYLVHSGLVVLAQDPVGQGERLSYYEKSIGTTTISFGVCEHEYAGCQCWPLGDGIARYFVHDAMRGVDYLCTRREVDRERIGVTGNSGGGTQSCLMMICDQRIAAAAPATFLMRRQTFMYTGRAQDAEQMWPGMSALGFDHEDILMMMVPKPVLVLAVKYDFFPVEGTQMTVARTRRFWEMLGRREDIELFEDTSVHHYTRPMAKKAAEFFSQHLLDIKVSPEDETIKHMEPSLLWCTKSGQVRGEIEGARAVYEENCDRIKEMEKYRNSFPEEERKERALKWLKEKVFSNRKQYELNPRHTFTGRLDDLSYQTSIWWSQEGILNHAFTFRDYRFEGQELPVTIAVWNGGTSCLQPHINWIRKTSGMGRAVMVLDVSGVGAAVPNPICGINPLEFLGAVFKLSRDIMWLDDSLAAMRTYDVLRAVEVVRIWDGLKKEDIQLYAHGRYGLYAQLASALDKRVKSIEVVDAMDSFASWVGARHYDDYDIMSIVLPGVLKYFDLPDIDRWIAMDKLIEEKFCNDL